MTRFEEADPVELASAVAALSGGGVVAFPTETFYGLGADALREEALRALLALKGRDAARAISVLIEPDMLDRLVLRVPGPARSLMAAHWPGPLTLALPARPGLPLPLLQDGCVAVRVSPHPLARALVRAFGGPVTATSCNPAGLAPARTPGEAKSYFPSVPVLGKNATPGGAPSTLVRVIAERVEILRRGAIDIKE
jgi:L-threonylcarbamoyladenylate synthase